MQKSWDGGGNNAYKIFSSRVEEGYIPNTILYVELFMTTMKIKNNLCDEYQYEIQKSRDGGGKNAYKIFTSWVEEGTIPNTISYVELFMNTLKIKNNFCNGHQYEIQKSQDRGGNSAYKIFLSRVEEGNIPNTISYMELFMNTMKLKNNFCIGHQYEMQKSRDGEGNNACKIIMCRVEERNVICIHKTCLELFTATMKKKQLSELSKVNSMKPKSLDRRGNSVKRTKQCKNLNYKKVSFNSKRSSPTILKRPRKKTSSKSYLLQLA